MEARVGDHNQFALHKNAEVVIFDASYFARRPRLPLKFARPHGEVKHDESARSDNGVAETYKHRPAGHLRYYSGCFNGCEAMVAAPVDIDDEIAEAQPFV